MLPRVLLLLALPLELPAARTREISDESSCNSEEGCVASKARSLLQVKSKSLVEQAVHSEEKGSSKSNASSVLVREEEEEAAPPLHCWAGFGSGLVARDAGRPVGSRWGVTPEVCQETCMGNPLCSSILYTTQWGGYCFLMSKVLTASDATKRGGLGYRTYYRKECAQCDVQDGSIIHGPGPCTCHDSVCTFGQRCSKAKGCHGEPGDVAEVSVVSQDLMGDYTWSACQSRFYSILRAVAEAKPSVLGCQEHPEFQSSDGKVDSVLRAGYHDAAVTVSLETGLAHLSYGVYYDADVLEPVGQPTLKMILDHTRSSENRDRYVSGTIFRHRQSGNEFAFFNTEWDEKDQSKQAEELSTFVQGAAYSGLARVIAGNFKTRQSAEPIEHLTSRMEMGMKDSLEGKGNTVHDNCCKADYILYTARNVKATRAFVDRSGSAGAVCTAGLRSDHALVGATLSFWR